MKGLLVHLSSKDNVSIVEGRRRDTHIAAPDPKAGFASGGGDDTWDLPVSAFMSEEVIFARLDTPLDEVRRTLERWKISAVPVLDDAGMLRGILSTKDLLRQIRRDIARQDDDGASLHVARTASALMRTAVLTVDERTCIGRAATEMLRHRVHRLVVVRDGRPSGILSTSDVMAAIAMAELNVPLEKIMTPEVDTIDLGTKIGAATERLDDANVRGLVVVDGTWPVGVFTHVEAIRAQSLPSSLRDVPVEQVMQAETICFEPSASIGRVARYARRLGVRRVLAAKGRRLKGIVTGFDMLKAVPT
jgi:predicted transcriptional regulator